VELPAELFRDLGYIFDSGEHLIRLINDLLDVSRAEIGALELFTETVQPESLLRDMFTAMAEQYESSQEIQWSLALPDHLPLHQSGPGACAPNFD
jgi:signal transduction histidine kinase